MASGFLPAQVDEICESCTLIPDEKFKNLLGPRVAQKPASGLYWPVFPSASLLAEFASFLAETEPISSEDPDKKKPSLLSHPLWDVLWQCRLPV